MLKQTEWRNNAILVNLALETKEAGTQTTNRQAQSLFITFEARTL